MMDGWAYRGFPGTMKGYVEYRGAGVLLQRNQKNVETQLSRTKHMFPVFISNAALTF